MPLIWKRNIFRLEVGAASAGAERALLLRKERPAAITPLPTPPARGSSPSGCSARHSGGTRVALVGHLGGSGVRLRLPPRHRPQSTSVCCAFPRPSVQPGSAAARGVSPCPSPRQHTGHSSARQHAVWLRHGVLCPGVHGHSPPRSGRTGPLWLGLL